MAHISRTRQVDTVHRSNIGDLLPRDLELNNFAVFCGEPEQRAELAAHGISRYVGQVGIVVIHNDSAMSDYLQYLLTLLGSPQLGTWVDQERDQDKVYDPLYGMSANGIANLLAPKDPLSSMQQGVNKLRTAILAYLDIMKYQFSQGRGPFGEYPYNLNLLLQLTEMPYAQLESSVLQYMPPQIAKSIANRMNGENVQQEVDSCVVNFASTMNDYLWQRGDFREHTRISIIDSMEKRQLICLRVPNSHAPLLDYIDAELQVLSNSKIPFLIVNCDVDISAHPAMQRWFLDSRTNRGYYTALVADTVASVTVETNQSSKLFSQYRQIFVFQCAGDEQAKPFSAQFGAYYREQRERHEDQTREPFHLFPSHQTGVAYRQVEERNITTNDLTGLRNGLLLCGNAYERPILINNFDMTGGIFDGALLP